MWLREMDFVRWSWISSLTFLIIRFAGLGMVKIWMGLVLFIKLGDWDRGLYLYSVIWY
jgi:hypothetical protein